MASKLDLQPTVFFQAGSPDVAVPSHVNMRIARAEKAIAQYKEAQQNYAASLKTAEKNLSNAVNELRNAKLEILDGIGRVGIFTQSQWVPRQAPDHVMLSQLIDTKFKIESAQVNQ